MIAIALIVTAIVAGYALLRLIKHVGRRKHEPIEYYRGWGGYWHPIGLEHRISKEDADAYHAEGSVYLIGYFNDAGKLTRVTKMLKGQVFFDFVYEYHSNGKIKYARITNSKGRVVEKRYDERGNPSGTLM